MALTLTGSFRFISTNSTLIVWTCLILIFSFSLSLSLSLSSTDPDPDPNPNPNPLTVKHEDFL